MTIGVSKYAHIIQYMVEHRDEPPKDIADKFALTTKQVYNLRDRIRKSEGDEGYFEKIKEPNLHYFDERDILHCNKVRQLIGDFIYG